MDGRRTSGHNRQKLNPLYVLFLGLVAAVALLLILSIVLGIRLGSAKKAAKTAEKQVEELKEKNTKLQQEITELEAAAAEAAKQETPAIPTGPDGLPELPGQETQTWLDLSGHSELSVTPTQLLDRYYTYYATAGVNLRSGPGTSYSRLATVSKGGQVEVAAKENGWMFVKTGNRFGWIKEDYLSTTKVSAQSSTSTSSQSSRRTEATSGSLHH